MFPMHRPRLIAASFALGLLVHHPVPAAAPGAPADAQSPPTARARSGGERAWAGVPGVVIDHSPAASGLYIGSPGLAVLPNGDYLASHDLFGPKSREHECPTTRVFRSADRGTLHPESVSSI